MREGNAWKSGARSTATIAVLLLAVCGPEDDTAQPLRSEVRDSAGVTIVENARPAPGSRLA